jgi:hypothetical protein
MEEALEESQVVECLAPSTSCVDKKPKTTSKKGEKIDYLHKWSSTPFQFDESIGINNGEITIEQLRCKKYEFSDKGYVQLINDCKSCIGQVKNVFYYKTYQNRNQQNLQVHVDMMAWNDMKNTLKIYPFLRDTNHTIWDFLSKKFDMISYVGAGHFAINPEEMMINMFMGFRAQLGEDELYNEKLVTDFLDIIKQNVCGGDETNYEFLIKWLAMIMQKKLVKTGVMPVITGPRGVGKSMLTDAFCQIIGQYALPNTVFLKDIFGQFNGIIEDKVFIVINEPKDYEKNEEYMNSIKSQITELNVRIRHMHVSETRRDCYGNYIITTNEEEPIREELGDRRIIYIRSKKVVDVDYFENFYASIRPEEGGQFTDEFLSSLYRYMLNIDITGFRPRCYIQKLMNNTDMNGNNSKLENQINNLDPLGLWILQHHKIAIEGFTKYDTFNDEGICDIKDFDKYKRKYLTGTNPTDRKRPAAINRIFADRGMKNSDRLVGGENKQYFYELKSREVEPGIHALIDYYKLKEDSEDAKDDI